MARCATNIDDCASNPCGNGGRCVDGVATYACDCGGSGYTGVNCERDVDECADDVRAARDRHWCVAGTCTNTLGGYDCACDAGYIGRRCAHADPCALAVDTANSTTSSLTSAIIVPHRCQNAAKCTRPAISAQENVTYECVCLPGFLGSLCDVTEAETARGSIPLTFILAPILGLVLLVAIIVCIVFSVVARKKRATRGTYSPSRQELTSTRASQMAFMMKQPPQEGLI